MPLRFWPTFLSLVYASVALAQADAPAAKTVSTPRALTPREGEAIVTAAWQYERAADTKPDCSHLVHEIYGLAGYPYPYASSFELYAGTESFVRVAKPQPGDLVVWRGHVGIVIDAKRHTFNSSVRSGLRTEFYDAPQWNGRGPARFYRYVLEAPRKVTVAQGRAAQALPQPVQVVPAPVVENSSESPVSLAQERATDSDGARAAAPDRASPPAHRPVEIPSSILVSSAQDRPTQEDVADAISELNNATGEILRREDFAQFGRKMIIYDELAVQRPQVKGERGSANTRIQSRVTLSGERIDRKRRHEKAQWNFLRTAQGWELRPPKDRAYVPRDVAIRALAARLASLTQDPTAADANLPAEVQIVRVLSALLEGR